MYCRQKSYTGNLDGAEVGLIASLKSYFLFLLFTLQIAITSLIYLTVINQVIMKHVISFQLVNIPITVWEQSFPGGEGEK